MSLENNRIRILLPTDFTKSAEIAFFHALKLTLAHQGKIRILHVDPPDGMTMWQQFPKVRNTLAKWGLIEHGAPRSAVETMKILVKKSIAVDEDAEKAIIKKIERHRVDLLMMATQRRTGLQRVLHKSIACNIAGKTRKNTFFFPENCCGFVDSDSGRVELNHILIPVSTSPKPKAAIDAALDLIHLLGVQNTRITLLHVAPTLETPSPCDLPDHDHVQFEMETAIGPLEETIQKAAKEKNSNCIVMATRGRKGLADMVLGSTTERVVHDSPCAVLAIHT